MTYSKCEQCGHRFEFDDANETQPCPECMFETRLFPVPRPVPSRPLAPAVPRGTIPFDVPLNRNESRARFTLSASAWSFICFAVILSFGVSLAFAPDPVRELLLFLGGMIAVGLLYFIPAVVAHKNEHPNSAAITVLNFVAGWTFIGWVVALVWACTNSARR